MREDNNLYKVFYLHHIGCKCFISLSVSLKNIEVICDNFLWSNTYEIIKKSPVNWYIVYSLKTTSGLDITSMTEYNQATIGKLLWNLKAKAGKLWVKWNNTYYLKVNDMMN